MARGAAFLRLWGLLGVFLFSTGLYSPAPLPVLPSLSLEGCVRSSAAFRETQKPSCGGWISWGPHHRLESGPLWPCCPSGAIGGGLPPAPGPPPSWDLSSSQWSRAGPLSGAWRIQPLMGWRLGARLPRPEVGEVGSSPHSRQGVGSGVRLAPGAAGDSRPVGPRLGDSAAPDPARRPLSRSGSDQGSPSRPPGTLHRLGCCVWPSRWCAAWPWPLV